MSDHGGGAARVKRFTLLLEMRCNSFCVFCGSRAVDASAIRVRRQLGLTVPRPTYRPVTRARLFVGRVRATLRWLAGRDEASRDAPRTPHGGFSLASARDAVQHARTQGFDALSLQGGEPTLWPWLPELIAHARAIGFREVAVVTNGRRMADAAFADRVLGAGLTHLVVSLLAADAAVHDELSVAPGAFDAALATIEHAAAFIAREPAPSCTLSVNLVVSAASVDDLPAQVELLAQRGARAGVIHLVRFHLFGDDPTVRARLRFAIGSLRAPLAAAFAAADRTGFALHADDVPPCLHPHLREHDVRRLIERAATHTRHAYAPTRAVDKTALRPRRRLQLWHDADERPSPAACRGCVFDAHCERVPDEYLDRNASALVPVTPASIGASIAADTGRGAAARIRLEEIGRAVAHLREHGLLGEDATREIAHALQTRFAVLMNASADAADGHETLAAFLGMLGLRPPREMAHGDEVLARARAAREARETSPHAPTHGWRLDFAPGYAVVIEAGATSRDDEIAIERVTAIAAAPDAPGGALGRALFLGEIVRPLREARRVRCTARHVETDRTGRWDVQWSHALPWAARLSRCAP